MNDIYLGRDFIQSSHRIFQVVDHGQVFFLYYQGCLRWQPLFRFFFLFDTFLFFFLLVKVCLDFPQVFKGDRDIFWRQLSFLLGWFPPFVCYKLILPQLDLVMMMMIIWVMMMMTKVMDMVVCWKLVSSDLHLGFGNFERRPQFFSLFSPTLFLHIIRGVGSENIMLW